MSWTHSIVVGVLTGLTAAILTGVVASMAVSWYHIPSREGGSGYFVLALVLLALIAGFVIGIAVSRTIAGRPEPGFLKALGWSQLLVLGSITLVGGVARLRADVPPTLRGQELLLNVEIRWPEGVTELPTTTPAQWSLRLSALSGRTARVSRRGPLWREDARLEGGRWIVPGAVELFTSRGKRLIAVEPDSLIPTGYLLSLPGYPRSNLLAWSAWLPKQQAGGPPPPGGFTYRFRVVPVDQPIRSEQVGPFEVQTIARGFSMFPYGEEAPSYTASADFRILYRGEPVTIALTDSSPATDRMVAVAVVGGSQTALVAEVNDDLGNRSNYLIVPEGDSLRKAELGPGVSWMNVPPLTSDPAVFAAATGRRREEGRIDRTNFARPGLFLLGGTIFDSRTLTVRSQATEENYRLIDRIPPLTLSPDEQSFVRLVFDADAGTTYLLQVTDLLAGERYELPLDQSAMRFAEIDVVDPTFIDHYFQWKRGADGHDRLVARTAVKPWPYRGRLTNDGSGYREYRVGLATEALATALIDFLVRDFHAEPVAVAEGAYAREVTIDGATVNIAFEGSDQHVGVWMERYTDTRLVETIAQRFDAVLATGVYDQHFAH